MILTELEAVSWALVSLAFGTIVRSLILAALCGCAAWLLRMHTAELRFWLWKWMLFGLLALPLLMVLRPPLRRANRSLARVESAILHSRQQSAVTSRHRSGNDAPVPVSEVSNSSVFVLVIPGLYFLVTAALLSRLRCNLNRVRRIAEGSEYISDPRFRELAHHTWLESGAFLRPRMRVSTAVTVPVTFDLDDIWILMPHSWPEWDEQKLRVVLIHEMAHVKRRDSANLLLASLATCLFWFHPLSWFLRRKLCALAEEACDEVAVASVEAPETYARFLIEFARDVAHQDGRLTTAATGMLRNSHIKRRLERLFTNVRDKQRATRGIAAFALALFAPAVYLVGAAQFDPPQQPKASQQFPWPNSAKATSLSREDVASLESAVSANPEDLESRMALIVYFGYNAQDLAFTDQLVWFIKHHPETQTLRMAQAVYRSRELLSQSSRERIGAAWEQAMAEHAGSARVLLNAASFLKRTDPERALEILQHAKALDAGAGDERNTEILAIYACAEIAQIGIDGRLNNIEMSLETGEKLSAQLEGSGDPALLAGTGRILVELTPPNDNGRQTERGLELIQQAIQLDPGNAKWMEVLQSAQAEPQRRLNYQRLLKPQPPQLGTVRISSNVAEAGLIGKVDVVYPPLALAARIQGVVEFTVTVGPDGKVQNIQLVRGHPLLVNAAKEAVLKRLYHPVLRDGTAVSFETEVIVPFRLPQ